MTALLDAIRDRLRSQCGLSEHECKVEPDEYPTVTVGDKWVAVMPGAWMAGPVGMTAPVLDELIGVDVAVVMRASRVASTREVFSEQFDNLEQLCRKIITAIHFKWEVLQAANLLIRDSSEPFTEPPKFGGGTNPMPVGPDFFGGGSSGGTAGIKRVLSFVGTRRMQHLETMT